MPRTAAKINQADIARAVRAVKQATGSAQVVFDTDGKVRVTPMISQPSFAKVDDDTEVDL